MCQGISHKDDIPFTQIINDPFCCSSGIQKNEIMRTDQGCRISGNGLLLLQIAVPAAGDWIILRTVVAAACHGASPYLTDPPLLMQKCQIPADCGLGYIQLFNQLLDRGTLPPLDHVLDRLQPFLCKHFFTSVSLYIRLYFQKLSLSIIFFQNHSVFFNIEQNKRQTGKYSRKISIPGASVHISCF